MAGLPKKYILIIYTFKKAVKPKQKALPEHFVQEAPGQKALGAGNGI